MEYQRKLSAGQVDESGQHKLKEQVKNVQRILKPITV
jgi:hypothetical protein